MVQEIVGIRSGHTDNTAIAEPKSLASIAQLPQAGLAKIAIVVIVGCCPYIPRTERHLEARSSTQRTYEQSKRPTPSKPRSKFYPLDKCANTTASVSKLESSVPEEHLELHTSIPRY
jgi:hypothetical protein